MIGGAKHNGYVSEIALVDSRYDLASTITVVGVSLTRIPAKKLQ